MPGGDVEGHARRLGPLIRESRYQARPAGHFTERRVP